MWSWWWQRRWLVWANSPWQSSYASVWATEIELRIGPFVFEEDLGHVTG